MLTLDDERVCHICKVSKKLIDFALEKPREDGRNYRCRECDSKRNREYYQKNKERMRETFRKYHLKRTVESVEKIKSRAKMKQAIKSGVLKRSPCEVCGDVKSQGHHTDYSKPLEITWLCLKHHKEIHRKAVSHLEANK